MSNLDQDLQHFMPGGEAAAEGTTARSGSRRAADAGPPVTELQVVEALRQVYDPEIPVNIYDLGLIYDLELLGDGDVKIAMTLTAPACPVAGEMPKQVADKVASLPGAGEVEVMLTWDPPWDKDRMSEDAKMALDMY